MSNPICSVNACAHLKFFAKIALATSDLSTCDRHHIGCVVFDVDQKSVLSVGRNGTSSNAAHCQDLCKSGDLQYADHQEWSKLHERHAEENALNFLTGETRDSGQHLAMIITHFPCLSCAKKIIDFNKKYLSQFKNIVFISDWWNSIEERTLVEFELQKAGIDIFKSTFDVPDLVYVKENQPTRWSTSNE
jgi:deoxycytidylate deaminase